MELLYVVPVLAGATFLLGPWVIAIIALRRAGRAERRLAALEKQLSPGAIARSSGSIPAPAPIPAPPPLTQPAPGPAVPAAEPAPAPAVPGAPAPTATFPIADLAAPAAAPPASRSPAAETVPPPPPSAAPPPRASLEEKLALVWFTRAGALTFLLGAGWFFKYAVDNEWIGPSGRVALGALTGAAILVLGEARRDRLRGLYLHALHGTGVAVLFVSAYASYALYRLVPLPVAFAAVALVALLGGALALRDRGEVVLAVALAGGLLAPAILSTGQDRPLALFGYLLVLTGLSGWAAARERFRAVTVIALAGTVTLFAGWYDQYFESTQAYREILARAVPVGAVVALSALWLRVAADWRRRHGDERWPLGLEVACLFLAHAGLAALLLDRPLLVGAAAAALGAVSAVVFARRSQLLALQAAAGFVALGFTWAAGGRWEARGAFMAGAGIWAAVYLVALAAALVGRREDPRPLHLVTAAGVGLGFVWAAIAVTRRWDSLSRAAAAAVAGAALLGLGRSLLPRARRSASVLLGVALALFAASAAFLLSGATTTVVWAAMAAVVAHLAARERDRDWLLGAALLFAAVAVRLSLYDLPRAVDLPLLNPRGLAFGAAAAALLLSARVLRSAGEGLFRAAASVCLGSGHLALLVLAVAEARDAAGLAREDLVTTLTMGAYAAMLVAIGFALRERLHRWLGLGLFALTLAKLGLYDVWSLERTYQIAVLLAVGALLLGASFLYARHGSRLADLLRGGPGSIALALVTGAALVAGPAAALEERPFRSLAPVEGVSAPGLWRAELPLAVYRASEGGGLGDLRLCGPAGEEVPWLVRAVGAPREARSLPARLLDPVVLPDGAARAVLDLGPGPAPHGLVRLDVEGDDFLRRVSVESSEDGRSFGLLADGGRVWAVPGGTGGVAAARSLDVRYPASRARWLRVTLLAGAGGAVQIRGAVVEAAPTAPPPPRREAPLRIVGSRREEGRRTLVELDAGGRLPPGAWLRLETSAAAFERTVRVEARAAGEQDWCGAGQGVVWRSPEGGPGEREWLQVPVTDCPAASLRLVIEDGDAAPIPVAGVTLTWPPEELVFRTEAGGPHRLLVGAEEVRAPRYDLAAVLARWPGARPAEARLGPLAPNPGWTPPPPPRKPFTERHRVALGCGLGALVVALGVWTARLLRVRGEPG